MKVLGLGNALVDILIQLDDDGIVESLNFPKGSMQLINQGDIAGITKKTELLPAQMVSGGSAANTIHGLASLGTSCGFIGKVGKDELGRFYTKDLQSAGVDACLLNSETVTGRAYTLITPDTERTFATYLGAAVEMQAYELDESIFSRYSLFHVEGYLVQNTTLIESAMRIAKSKGLKISLDLASFNVVEANLEFLRTLIPRYVDIIFANEEEARSFTGKSPKAALKELGEISEIAVVKIGEKGSMVQSGNEFHEIGIFPADCIDTTGAGDQYTAGFLHGLSLGFNLNICGEIGTLLAGRVIENYGARIPQELWPGILEKVRSISMKK
jgi:sugar/nucleoside kinase (ribokinase family)